MLKKSLKKEGTARKLPSQI